MAQQFDTSPFAPMICLQIQRLTFYSIDDIIGYHYNKVLQLTQKSQARNDDLYISPDI